MSNFLGTFAAILVAIVIVWIGLSAAGANDDFECSVDAANDVFDGDEARRC